MLLWSTVALARFAPQEWPADQSGVDLWSLGHVTTIQIDNMSGVGTRFACTDSTGQLIPSATACVASGAAFYQFVDDPSVGTQPQRGHLGFGESASTLCTNDDAGNDRTNAELCTVAGNPFNVGGSTSLITKVSTNSYGQATLVQAVGLGPSLAQSGGNLIDQSYEYVSRSTNAPVNAVNMGALASGVNCQTVTTGVAVPRICAAGTDYVASVAVTAPVVNNGTAANPNVGVSLPANQVAYGTGTNVSSSANFVVDTVSFSPDIQVGVAGRIRSGLGTDGGDLLTVAGTVFSGSHQIWKDSTPSAAANEGMSVPGGSVTSDLVYSMYNGSWNERMRLLQLGGLRFPTMAAPSTPASGFSVIYIDSTSLNVAAKNAAGTVNHGVQTDTGATSQWIRAIADTGAVTKSQPAFTDVSGTETCGQSAGPYTGSVVKAANSCATKVTAIDESGGLNIPIGACTADGQAFVKVAGSMTCRLPTADLANDYTAPWVIGMHDGASAQWTTSGTWAANQIMVTAASSHVTTSTTAALFAGRPAMELAYYLELTPAILTTITGGNQYVATSSSVIVTPGVIEYPIGGDFVPQSCKLAAKIDGSNTITSGSLGLSVMVNGSGSPLSSTCTVTLTSASSGVVNSGLALYSGSPASSDTIGVLATPNGTTIIASGTLRLTLRVRLSPELTF